MAEYLSVLTENAQRDLDAYKTTALEIVKAIELGATAATTLTNSLAGSSTKGDLASNFKKSSEAQSELSAAANEYNKIVQQIQIQEAKLSALTSDAAKQQSSNAAAIRESIKSLKDQAEAENATIQARKAAAAAAKQLASDEKELLRLIKEEEKANLAEKRKADAAAAKQLAQSNKEYSRTYADLLKQQDKEAAALAALDDDYKQLQIQLDAEIKKYRELFFTLGEGNKATLAQQKVVQGLDAVLKKVDGNTGNFKRNVGDYSQATTNLGRSFSTIASELPSLSYGIKLFLSSISNNLGPAIIDLKALVAEFKAAKTARMEGVKVAGDEAKATALAGGATEEAASQVGELAKEQALAALEGEKHAGILKTIGKSLLSFNFLVGAAVAVFSIFGPKIYDALTGATEATKAAEKANKEYEESLRNIDRTARATALTEDAAAQQLYRVAIDRNREMRVRIAAVEELQKKYPDYLGNIRQESILTGQAADAMGRLSKAIYQKSLATAYDKKAEAAGTLVADAEEALSAQQAIADEAVKKSADYRKRLKDKSVFNLLLNDDDAAQLEDNAKKAKGAVVTLSVALEQAKIKMGNSLIAAQKLRDEVSANIPKEDPRRTATVIQKELDKVNKDIDYYGAAYVRGGKTLKSAREALEKELDKFRGTEDKKKEKKPHDTTNAELSGQKMLIEANAGYIKEIEKSQEESNKRIYEDETQSLQARLEAYNNYVLEQKNLAGLDAATEQSIILSKLDAVEKAERTSVKKRTSAQKDLILQREALEQQLLTLQEKRNSAIAAIETQAEQDRAKFRKQASQKEYSDTLKAAESNANLLAEAYKADTDRLRVQYDKKVISEREYRNKLKAVQTQYKDDAIDIQIAVLQNEIDNGGEQRDEIDKLIAKINELKAAKNENTKGLTQQNGGILGLTDKDRKDLDNISSYADGVISAFQGINDVLDQISAKRKAQTDAEIAAIDKRKDKDLEALEIQSLSLDERAKQTTEINARAEAEKEALAQKQKKRDIDDARRNKALNIAKIIAETALAVVHQLGSGDPYTAIARAIAAGAVGAAQLAVAIATPIPAYGEGAGIEGRPETKEGLALIGEKKEGAGYEAELIMEKGKKPYWTSGPQIKHLAAGTRVIPKSKIDSMMFAGMSTAMIQHVSQPKPTDVTGIEYRLDKWGAKHYHAILKSRPVVKKSTFDNDLFRWSNK